MTAYYRQHKLTPDNFCTWRREITDWEVWIAFQIRTPFIVPLNYWPDLTKAVSGGIPSSADFTMTPAGHPSWFGYLSKDDGVLIWKPIHNSVTAPVRTIPDRGS